MQNQINKILALNEVGSVNHLLQKFDPKLGQNEGIGKYSYLSIESPTGKPYTQSTEITVPLTNANVDVVEFHRSFFTLTIELWLNFTFAEDRDYDRFFYVKSDQQNDIDASTLCRKCDLFFIGYKNATDCIDSYRIQHNGVDIGSTMQNKASMESFLYNQMKPQTEKGNKHGSYSLWEDVARGDESVCGIYLTYEQLREQITNDNKILHIQFPVTIGFDMLLPLQGFNLFPNCCFGDLSLIIKTNPNSLVWACTDAKRYISDRRFMTVTGIGAQITDTCELAFTRLRPLDIGDFFDHRFNQVRVPGKARSNIYVDTTLSDASYVVSNLTINPDTLMTKDAQSTITGFSLKDSVKQALAQYYSSVPFVIPAERIYLQSFSTGPTASGLNCSMTIPLNNAKEIICLFPRNANDLTVFRNPQYQHLMLTLLNRNFPQKGANTNSTEFYRLELEACNLDTILPPTESFENSYLKKVCPAKPIRQRCNEDDTDFVVCFNLERQSSNAFFADPVTSASETITLVGSPQVQGDGDIYYNLAAENDADKVNEARPILGITSDTFWLFSSNRLATYEIAATWNECLAKNYPEILQRLVAAQ